MPKKRRPVARRSPIGKRVRAYYLPGFWKAYGLPEPVKEWRFDPARKWRVDFAWPGIGLALEVEGGVWTRGRHVRGKGFLNDLEKYNQLAILGYALLRCTPEQLESGEIIPRIQGFFE